MTQLDESASVTRTNFEDVGDFHEKFDLPTSFHLEPPSEYGPPRPLDHELLRFRMKFLLEELTEFIRGAGYELWGGEDGEIEILRAPQLKADHAQMFDALLDLTYVAMGTAHLAGYPWQEGWRLVQAANMSKVRAMKDGSDSLRGSAFDVVKPEGFIPPDIEGLLRDYGW